jgi:hypothetical protein
MILGKFPNIFHVFGKGHVYVDMFLAKNVLSQNVRCVVPKMGGCKNHPKFVMFNNETNGFGAQHEKHCFFHLKFSKIM